MRSLTIVVVHYEAPQWCSETVSSLLASDGVAIRITVVNNGGILPHFSDSVREIESGSNRGYTGGANLGLEQWLLEEQDMWVGLASHDVTVEPDTLARLLEVGDSSDDIGIVSPSLTHGVKEGGGAEPVDKTWVSGTLMLIRRDLLMSIGRFDERFGSYVEDTDFGLRARKAGWRVVASPTVHAHQRGSSIETAPVMISANRALLAILHGSKWRGRIHLALLACASTVRGPFDPLQRRYANARWRALTASLRRPSLRWPKIESGRA